MEIEEMVKKALRLSDAAGNVLLEQIKEEIKIARMNMIRVGVSKELANGNNELIKDAIVMFCLMKMGNPAYYDRYKDAWEFNIDSIRKSQDSVAFKEEEAVENAGNE